MRVLVVDDHQAFRQALTEALGMVGEIEVAGEAGGGFDACREAALVAPDVVLMDLSMPDLSGFDAMVRIHERDPSLPVVILTANADAGVEAEARRAGASGFVAKGTGLEDIVLVLSEVARPATGLVRDGPLDRAEPPGELDHQLADKLRELIEHRVEIP